MQAPFAPSEVEGRIFAIFGPRLRSDRTEVPATGVLKQLLEHYRRLLRTPAKPPDVPSLVTPPHGTAISTAAAASTASARVLLPAPSARSSAAVPLADGGPTFESDLGMASGWNVARAVGAGPTACGLRSGYTGCQERRSRKVLVQVRPMDADTAADEAPILPSCRLGIAKPREPIDRHGNFPSIDELHQHPVGFKAQALCPRLLRNPDAHSTAP
jgi:hypothetical protein